MNKITEILQQKAFNLAIKDIVKFAKNSNDRSLDIAIVQFFVDFLGKSYTLSEDDFEELDGTINSYQHLAADIFESEDIEVSSEVRYSDFIKRIINELYISESLDHTSLTCWIEILTAFIEHEDIAEQATIKAKSHTMLSYMLHPLTQLLILSDDPSTAIEDDFKLAVEEAIERIMANMEKSLKYVEFSIACMKHLNTAIINRPEAFIKDVSGMKIFKVLLNYDVRPQLVLALTLLDDLCQIESLKGIVKEFFFPPAEDIEEERIFDKVFSLIHHKNLKSEVIALIKSIIAIAEHVEFLSDQQRYEIFINVFNKNKKVVMETCSLMTAMKVDFWMEIIKMLNYYVEPTEIDIPHVLASFESTHEIQPKTFLEIACNNINDTVTSQRAAEMFLESIKMTRKVDEILPLMDNALQTCVADAKTFCFIIECFHEIEHDVLVDFFKDNANSLASIIDNIGNAFQAYRDSWRHKFSASVLFIFFKISPQVTLLTVTGIMKHNLTMFYQATENGIDCTVNVEKMFALLEIRYWTTLNDKQLKKLYGFGKSILSVNDEEQMSTKFYVSMLRLHTNVLKHMWVKLMRQGDVNFVTTQDLIVDVQLLSTTLWNYALNEKFENELQGRCLVIASIFDVNVMFQQKMKEKSTAQIFRNFSLQLSKKELIWLVEDNVVQFIFHKRDNEVKEFDFYKKFLMQSFVSLYLNHFNLPTLTTWEAFLRHYHLKSPYKDDMEQLMLHAMKMEKGIFDKTVAFAILNICNWTEIEIFRNFYQAFEIFLKIQQPDVKTRSVRYAVICSFALERLTAHMKNTPNHADRLMPLDCLTIVIKNLDTNYKKNLCRFIKLNDTVKLSTAEKQKLELFENMLKN